MHVVISLVTLLGAFACAGFILASVGVPDLTCAQLKCSEGGVTCSPFYLWYGDKNVSWGGNSSTLLKRPPLHLLLDPRLAQLNNDTLGEMDRGETSGYAVTCRDYSYVAMTAFPSGQRSHFENFTMLDVFGKVVNETCYVLLSQATFENGSFLAEPREFPARKGALPEGDVLVDWYALRPNPFTLWCSSNDTHSGPGWLPLPMDTAYTLLNSLAHERAGHVPQSAPYGGRYMAGLTAANRTYCPVYQGFEGLASTPLTRQANMMGVQLFPANSNPWKFPDEQAMRRWTSTQREFGAPSVDNSFTSLGDMYEDVQQRVVDYYAILGWEGKGAGVPCQSKNGFIYPVCKYHHKISVSDRRPLSGAFPYATLRYQCSGADQGVLCDYYKYPPLAVDEQGNYLSKRSLSAQSDSVLFDVSPTTVWVQWAVVAMLVVALASNLSSIVFLGYPFFRHSVHYVAERARKLYADFFKRQA